MQARIFQPKISVASALQKYATELDGIVLNSMLETDQSNDPVVRLQHLRNEKLPAGDILGYKQSNHRLAFNKNGRYGGFLTDTGGSRILYDRSYGIRYQPVDRSGNQTLQDAFGLGQINETMIILFPITANVRTHSMLAAMPGRK